MTISRGPRVTRSRSVWIASILLVILVWSSLGGAVKNGFVNYDDDLYLTKNPFLSSHFGSTQLTWAFTTSRGGSWHPLTWISHMIDVRLFGMTPGGHHAVGLVLHCANVLLLFALLRGLTGVLWPGVLVAALFAVHPLHVESVAWAAERKDLLSTLFALAAALVYVQGLRQPGRRALNVAAPLLFSLALMAKPMPISLPLLLLLLDWWPLGRWSPERGSAARTGTRLGHVMPPARLWLEKTPLLLLSLASGVATWMTQSGAGAVQSFEAIPLPARAANALVSYARYLHKTVWPSDLAIFYPYPWNGHPPLVVLCALALLAALTVLAVRQANRRPWIAAGLLWYLVSLLPVIGIVQVGVQAMADRYTYLPLVGVFTAVAWCAAETTGYGRRLAPAIAAVCIVVVGILGVASARQVATWRDGVTLFSQAVAATGDNHIAHNNLGTALLNRNQPAKALPHFEEAIRIAPMYSKEYLNLGRALAALGRQQEAVVRFREAISRGKEEPITHLHLAQSLEKLGRWEEAIASYREFLRVEPRNPLALDLLALALARVGRPGEAVALLETATAIDPANASISGHLAVARAQLAAARTRGPDGNPGP